MKYRQPSAKCGPERCKRVRRRWLMSAISGIMILAGGCSGTDSSVIRGGTAWSAPVRVESNGPNSSSLYGVSCPTAGTCIAVDENGSAFFWHRQKWSGPEPVGPGGTLTSISCPSTRSCVAIAAGGSAMTYNDNTWSLPVSIGPAATYKVSCPTVTFCAAVGASGTAGVPSTVASFDGRSWSTSQTSGTGGLKDRFLDVSCATPQFCVAVNLDGETLIFDGHRWSAEAGGGPPGMVSVSCPSPSWCLAITHSGEYATFDGASWTTLTVIPSFATAFASSVSCMSVTRCTVFGLSGMAVTWEQGRWSTPVRVFPGGYSATVAVSCVVPDTCMAVTSKGEAASN